VSEKGPSFHLDEDSDVSSRNTRFIDRSVVWTASRFDIGEGTKIADLGCGLGCTPRDGPGDERR
jgi:hypothetical protein